MKPSILFFDLETTGTNPETDRIVQIAFTKATFTEQGIDYDPPFTLKVNPGIPIPKEATDIHGITDEMVSDLLPFSRYAEGIFHEFNGRPLGGYNIARFDVALLWHEFARAGIDWSGWREQPIIDAYGIYAKREKRDLTAAVQFYCGEQHDGHDAGRDTEASIKVFAEQVRYYKLDTSDLEALAKETSESKFLDISRKIAIGENGQPEYAFGKYRGQHVLSQPDYARWMIEKGTFSADTKRVLLDILLEAPPCRSSRTASQDSHG